MKGDLKSEVASSIRIVIKTFVSFIRKATIIIQVSVIVQFSFESLYLRPKYVNTK